jgi:hypothetical protein
MLFSRKTIATFLALAFLALAPLGTVRADDADAPKKDPSAAKLKLSDLAPGKGKKPKDKPKEKTPLLKRLAEKRAKK